MTASLLRALADENRLRILALLAEGELCVCHIVEALGLSQPNTSQHLSVLRHAGVIRVERRGSWAYYRLSQPDDPHLARVVAEALAAVGPLSEAERAAVSRGSAACP